MRLAFVVRKFMALPVITPADRATYWPGPTPDGLPVRGRAFPIGSRVMTDGWLPGTVVGLRQPGGGRLVIVARTDDGGRWSADSMDVYAVPDGDGGGRRPGSMADRHPVALDGGWRAFTPATTGGGTGVA